MTRHSHTLGIAFSALVLLAPATAAQRRDRAPDELRGSPASVEKMYHFAKSHRMSFYLTPTNVTQAIEQGRLVPLTGDATYEITRGVGFSYATREAKAFVTAFAPQYLIACGTPLTVTSAARPMSRQPRNGHQHSVHPTGIAVDLRRPYRGPCLTWLRGALTQLEKKGIIEATEERHPAHVHLAVLVPPGRPVKLPDLTIGVPRPVPVTTVAVANGEVRLEARTTAPTDARAYTVRQGDTLWEIATKNGVTVAALARANKRSQTAPLRPGTTLVLPEKSEQ